MTGVPSADLLIVKIGGGSGLNLDGIIADLAALSRPTIIVHGANALRDEMAKAMGVVPRTITSMKGYTSVFSDTAMLDVMMASYAGVRNKRIVEMCQRHGINAVGLTGLDGRTVQGRRNPGIRTEQDGRKVLLRDFSGKPQSVNVTLLTSLLRQGYTPVLTAPIVDEEGYAINMENDDVVTVLARDVGAGRVISFIEAPGLLRDVKDETSLVKHIDPADLEAVEANVDGRMRRKIKAIRTLFAAQHCADLEVTLADGRGAHPLRDALAGGGTTFAATVSAHAARTSTTRALQERFELDVYGKRGIALASATGTYVYDETGKRYIDCIAGQGAVNLGHQHPDVVAAMVSQLTTLSTCPGAFYNETKARYLQALVTAAPVNLTRAFLCNSGTEAIEAALKFARLHTQRPGIVAMDRGFHGRTFGAMTATGNPQLSAPFHPLVPGVSHIPFGDVEQLRETVSSDTAAVVLELVQGEGGVHPADPAFVAAARKACDKNGALLIIDEVQTGFGRTGTLFACEQFDVRPDLLCLAKGIANGAFPMGAVVVDAAIEVPVGLHGSTFGGHPVGCAAALATLNALIGDTLLSTVAEKGARLVAAIQAGSAPLIREIRYRGLMVGLELKTRVRPILGALAERRVLALPAGNKVLRLLPPLTIDEEDLRTVAAAVIDVCSTPISSPAET